MYVFQCQRNAPHQNMKGQEIHRTALMDRCRLRFLPCVSEGLRKEGRAESSFSLRVLGLSLSPVYIHTHTHILALAFTYAHPRTSITQAYRLTHTSLAHSTVTATSHYRLSNKTYDTRIAQAHARARCKVCQAHGTEHRLLYHHAQPYYWRSQTGLQDL